MARSQVRYVASLDSLFLFLHGTDRPAVGYVLPEQHFTVLVDPETDEFLGVEIDHFLSEAVIEHPEFQSLLDIPGLPPRLVKRARQHVDPTRRTQEAVRSILDRIMGQGESEGGGLRIAFQ